MRKSITSGQDATLLFDPGQERGSRRVTGWVMEPLHICDEHRDCVKVYYSGPEHPCGTESTGGLDVREADSCKAVWTNQRWVTRVSYAAVNRSLAILEYLAHIDPLYIPSDLVIAALDGPAELMTLKAPALPAEWKEYPAPASLRRIGDRFIRDGQSALMFVASALACCPRYN